MMIYDILAKEHRVVKNLLERLISLDDKDEARFALIEKIEKELVPHSRAEETVFYNAIRALDSDAGDASKVMHGYREHMEAESLLRLLQVKDKVSLDWKSTARKLKDALDHHVEEEESELFALGRKVLSDADAKKIGQAFKTLKEEIKGENMLETSLDMVKNLMPPRLSKVLEIRDQNIHK